MKIEQRREGKAIVVCAFGRLDALGAADLEAHILAIAERGDSRVVLDCTGMTYLSSGGLRAVLIGAKTCQRLGGGLVIAALGPECRTVMETSGFLPILDCHETVDAALAAPDRAAPAGDRMWPATGDGPAMEIEGAQGAGAPGGRPVAERPADRRRRAGSGGLGQRPRRARRVSRGARLRRGPLHQQCGPSHPADLRPEVPAGRWEPGPGRHAAAMPVGRVHERLSCRFIDLHETREAALAALA